MGHPLETIRLSQQARDQLIKLKRVTRLKQWNVLCRWAFCTSLAEPSPPTMTRIPADSSVEMTWRVFGGEYERIYLALLHERCKRDGLGVDPDTLAIQFRLHLHRGIAYLAANRSLGTIADLVALSFPPAPTTDNENGVERAPKSESGLRDPPRSPTDPVPSNQVDRLL